MSFETERAEIEGRFQDLFKDGSNNEFAPVQYPNKPRPDVIGLQLDLWARLTVLHGDAMNKEIGTDKTRYPGLIVLEIYSRENTGEQKARLCGDKMREIFQGQRITIAGGDILFRECTFKFIADEAGWAHHNAVVAFRRDEN